METAKRSGRNIWLRIVFSPDEDCNNDVTFTLSFDEEDDIVFDAQQKVQKVLGKNVQMITPEGDALTNHYIKAGTESMVVAYAVSAPLETSISAGRSHLGSDTSL